MTPRYGIADMAYAIIGGLCIGGWVGGPPSKTTLVIGVILLTCALIPRRRGV